MSYAPAELVVSAVEGLNGAHPLAVVTLPALLRKAQQEGVDPVASGVPFGSSEEAQLLQDFFVLPRPPDADRPYRAPWSSTERWQKKKYPGGGLQRLRTTDASAQGRVLRQVKQSKAQDIWYLRATAGAELRAWSGEQIRIVDLALWMGRNEDVNDLDELLAWLNAEFKPNQADLLGTIYTDEVPPQYRDIPFGAEPLDDDAAVQLGSLPAAPVVNGTLIELVQQLEAHVTSAGYQLPPGLVRRVLTAWLRGDVVVLVGQPGTGKTMFASTLGRAMEAVIGLDPPLLIPIRADFDEAEFLGYERLNGSAELREFSRTILQTERPLEARVVVLEEFNLASIETYMASVLIASQEQERLVRLPAGLQSQLPIDTFFIATCNSYRDEPETRTRVSAPTKRRSTIITMPNVLGDRFDADPEHAVLELAIGVVKNEAKRVSDRRTGNRAAQFDALRGSALDSVTSLEMLSPKVRDVLTAVSKSILTTSAGRSWFTLGLLKDVILQIVHAERDEAAELQALGQAVADKLVHQVRGSHEDVEGLRFASAELPNADEISRLLDRTMDGPSDELLPLL